MRASRVRKPARLSGTRSSGSCSTVLPLQGLRRLRPVRMLRARVDLELRDLLSREPVLRQHPLHGLAQNFLRAAIELLAERAAAQAAGVAGMAVVALLVELV